MSKSVQDSADMVTTSNNEDVMLGSADTDDVLLRPRGHFINANSKIREGSSSNLTEIGLIESISEHLETDILACDVKLSLFIGAARSYRHDSSLSPFPPFFIDSAGSKDIKGVLEAISCFPSLTSIKKSLNCRKLDLSFKQLKLLSWIFNGGSLQLSLRSMKVSDYLDTLSNIGINLKPTHVKPNLILKVSKHNTESWKLRCESEDTFYGFHGSRLDNWFSILNNGLQQHRSVTSKFGEGIYLSSDLTLSLNYSTSGVSWEKSLLGSSISCVAINQVINHQNVKIHSDCPVRGRVEDSEGGNIPEHHILVRDNQLTHTRFVMVYCGNGLHNNEISTSPTANQSLVRKNRVFSWISSNKMLFVILCYAVLLAIIGLSNSRWFKRFLAKQWYATL